MTVQQGDVLAGKYRVDELLGSGGMGMVVSAHHLQLDERVAIKFLLPEAMHSPEAVARFLREARAATKIKSEHGVRIIDVGNFETGEPYMVMEHLQGQDLGQVLRSATGPLAIENVAEYLLQACEALAEAHALGIIHRDLKPSNLFLTRRKDGSPQIKVLDFGISKVTPTAGSGPDLGLTKTTAMMGSPLYMSPEQMASSRDVDARTDIWALGVTFYELLSGRPPFNAETVPQLCAMVLQQEPEPLATLRPDLPPLVSHILARCLKKSPAERYANIAELAVDLGQLGSKRARTSVERVSAIIQQAGLSVSALALPPSSGELSTAQQSAAQTPAAQPPAATAVSWADTAPPVRRRSLAPVFAIGGAVGLLAVVGTAALLISRLGAKPAEAEPAASALASAQPAQLVEPPAPTATAAPSVEPNVEPPTAPGQAPAAAVSGKAKPASKTAAAAKDPKPAANEPKLVKPAEPSPSKPTGPAPATSPTLGGRL